MQEAQGAKRLQPAQRDTIPVLKRIIKKNTQKNHPCYGAVDGTDEGVVAREDFVDEETDYSCSAACHLRMMANDQEIVLTRCHLRNQDGR